MEPTNDNLFNKLEEAKKRSKSGAEYWMARQLQEILEYQRWDRFMDVVDRAIAACNSTGVESTHHFSQTGQMVSIGSGAARQVPDFFLSRYACYLIAMNGDTSKPVIGFAQTYFAVQARRQEVQDQLAEQNARLEIRERVRGANKALNSAAKDSGVTKFPFFQDAGYKGLYGGLGNKGY